MKIKLINIYVIIAISLFFISCATTSNSSSSGVYVGEDTGEIGIVNNWKNPDFKGGKTTKITAEGFASADGRGEADAIERSIESAKRNAVEQAVGSIVQGSTLVENNKLISSKLIILYEIMGDEEAHIVRNTRTGLADADA